MSSINSEKHALVTGGSHGIGQAIAISLARQNTNVAICARDIHKINEVVNILKKTGVKVLGIQADVLKKKDIEKVEKKIIKEWGTIDIIINNVGGGGRWGKETYEDTPFNVWEEVYQKNTNSAIHFTMWAIPYMREKKWGRVITISSIYGKEGGGRPWFNMAKAAQISLMKTLAMTSYLARDGITFNSVAPGAIMIPNTGWEEELKKDQKKFKKKLKENYPLGRLGTPQEIANIVTFLCSNEASFINGACITADGGESRSF